MGGGGATEIKDKLTGALEGEIALEGSGGIGEAWFDAASASDGDISNTAGAGDFAALNGNAAGEVAAVGAKLAGGLQQSGTAVWIGETDRSGTGFDEAGVGEVDPEEKGTGAGGFDNGSRIGNQRVWILKIIVHVAVARYVPDTGRPNVNLPRRFHPDFTGADPGAGPVNVRYGASEKHKTVTSKIYAAVGVDGQSGPIAVGKGRESADVDGSATGEAAVLTKKGAGLDGGAKSHATLHDRARNVVNAADGCAETARARMTVPLPRPKRRHPGWLRLVKWRRC